MLLTLEEVHFQGPRFTGERTACFNKWGWKHTPSGAPVSSQPPRHPVRSAFPPSRESSGLPALHTDQSCQRAHGEGPHQPGDRASTQDRGHWFRGAGCAGEALSPVQPQATSAAMGPRPWETRPLGRKRPASPQRQQMAPQTHQQELQPRAPRAPCGAHRLSSSRPG